MGCMPTCVPRCSTISRLASRSRRRGSAARSCACVPRPGSPRRSIARSMRRSSPICMDLRARLTDRQTPVFLYGTTPPRAGSRPEQVADAIDKLAARIQGLPLDGLVVYDIQDESGRTSLPRPFPFIATVDPRQYSSLLRSRTRLTPIVYKALGALDEASWQSWLVESAPADLRYVSVVWPATPGGRFPLPLSPGPRPAAQ